MTDQIESPRQRPINKEEEDRLQLELEIQDEVGYHGGYNRMPSMKNQPTVPRPRYTDEEVDMVLMALATSLNSRAEAFAKLKKWQKQGRIDRIPPDVASIGGIRSRNMERFFEVIATTKAATALLEVMDDTKSPNAKLQAAIHALDRGLGKVAQKVEVDMNVMTFQDIENARKEAERDQRKFIEGELSDPQGMGLPPEVQNEDEDGDVGL